MLSNCTYFCYFTENYVLAYLARCPKLATFVQQALVLLFARLTKIGWFEMYKKEHVFRNLLTQLSGFLQVSPFK